MGLFHILPNDVRDEFDRKLAEARALLDDADPDNDDEARELVTTIKAERRAARKHLRQVKSAERKANGGGLFPQLAAAVIDRERAVELYEREIKDLGGALIRGRIDADDALHMVGEAFKAEIEYIVDGGQVVPVLKRFGVPYLVAVAIGWGIELADGPLAAAAWDLFEAEVRERIAKVRKGRS